MTLDRNAVRLNLKAMKDSTMATKSEIKTSDRTGGGVLPNVVHMALDVADRGQSTALAVLQDARTELRSAVDSGLELAEKLATGAVRFARKTVSKLDDAAAEALNKAERTMSSAVNSARETTHAASELASKAASGVAGSHSA